ncbi:MAG: hypothetical protein KAK00_04340 [Nanoarchaeota archaeon]|nr:hypothetical protein [Nanoarchaeota archaeon]
MKKYLLLLVMVFSLPLVFSDAPPALPMEIWGEATIDGGSASDGLNVEAVIDGQNYAQYSVTEDGYYDVIITGLDKPLTYNNDSDCSTHWGNGEACVQCTQDVDCVEGPQDEENVKISIDGDDAEETFSLERGSILNEDVTVIVIVVFTKDLPMGWNLFSLPLNVGAASLSDVLISINGNYTIVWTIVDGNWKSSTSKISPITTIEPDKGYLIHMNATDTLELEGTPVNGTIISTIPIWNTVGYPSLIDRLITGVLAGLDYEIVWTLVNGNWKSSTSKINPITMMQSGYGYLLSTQVGGNYTVNND